MTSIKHALTDADGEVRELTPMDFKRARRTSEAFSAKLQAKLGMSRTRPTDATDGFQKVATKVAKDFEDDVKTATESLVLCVGKSPAGVH